MNDTQHKCQDWLAVIKCGETSTLQFKQAFAGQKALASELIAFANSKGGILLVGIEDKTGKIVGLTYDEIQTISREVAIPLMNKCVPRFICKPKYCCLKEKVFWRYISMKVSRNLIRT